jgi:hypothetical protein
MALALLPTFLYALRSRQWTLPLLTPVFLVVPALLGLLYHLLAMVAATGIGNGTPGWYLHIFAGPLALVLALGWAGRAVMLPLIAYAIAFFVAVAGMQVAFFSGCLARSGVGKVSLVEAAGCMVDLAPLGRIVLPDLALAAATLACVALLAGFALAASGRFRVAGL